MEPEGVSAVSIHLFKHNQAAYEAAVSMMEREGKAAVIHPTGTGKSFIAFKLADEHPDARICWLAPSEYIYHTQLENVKRTLEPGEELHTENIFFYSYSRLMVIARNRTGQNRADGKGMTSECEKTAVEDGSHGLSYQSCGDTAQLALMKNEASMEELAPDYIVLDEFHRCGAPEWGKSVQELLDMYPNAKLLGLSATNVRYLDSQRDMAQEIFDGHIASEMTLGGAIARGILSAPKYVVALYSYGKELQKLQQRVQSIENTGLAAKNQELLELLRRALEQADGLDRVFARHMKKNGGKYIVFCADKEHMDEMKEHVQEWFHSVDTKPHIYTAYYDRPETSKDFAAFKADDSAHLKLLFCIDMLNEGVHVDDVDGVILLRPTVSPIIYLQQIGRALSAGTAREPIIFDLVNNFESLTCIDYLEREMDEAFSLMPVTQGEKKRFYERFQIVDETRDCRALFRQLQVNLSSPWEIYYEAAAGYYRENGNLRIPKSYVTDTGLTLGSWLQTQRRVYAGKISGSLTEEKIEKLNQIGMVWDARGSSWEEGFRELEAYYRQFGNVDVKVQYCSDSGYPLGRWVSNLRTAVKKKGSDVALTAEQQEKLEALGMIWDKNGEKWERYVHAADKYRKQHGDLDIPAKYVTEDGIPLGNWLHGIRHGRSGSRARRETLDEEQIRQLEELGITWEKSNATLWNTKFELAREYYNEHGNLDVPVTYCVGDVRLGRWISNIRCKRRKPGSSGMVLDDSRIRQLDSIGMNWK